MTQDLHPRRPAAILISIFLLLGFLPEITAQRGCEDNPGSLAAAASCSFGCTPEQWDGGTFGYAPGPNAGWCGSIENDQYIAFVASQSSVSWFFTIDSHCVHGLQFGVYNLENILIGTCIGQATPGQIGTMTASRLTPCETYLLRIDGIGGDECGFALTPIQGIDTGSPSKPGPMSVEGPSQFCWGTERSFSFSRPQGSCAAIFEWRIDAGTWSSALTTNPSIATIQGFGTDQPEVNVVIPQMPIGFPTGTCDTAYLSARGVNLCGTSAWSDRYPIIICDQGATVGDRIERSLCEGDTVRIIRPGGSTISFTADDPIGTPIPLPAITDPNATCVSRVDTVVLRLGASDLRTQRVVLRGNEVFNPCDNPNPPIPTTGNFTTTCRTAASAEFPCGGEVRYEVFRLDPVVILGPDNATSDPSGPGRTALSPEGSGTISAYTYPDDQYDAAAIPRVFSPGGEDADNCLFVQSCQSSIERVIRLRIINTLGQVVFERGEHAPDQALEGWDGSYRGQLLSPQVLSYWVELEFKDGRREMQTGQFALLD